MQLHVQVLFSAGSLPIKTVGEPGAHGATGAGIHGIGVNTPIAAAVAASTVGLAGDMHIPNGGMFTSGFMSIMVAAGRLPHRVLLVGNTLSALGATPNVQANIAPLTTCCAIEFLLLFLLIENYFSCGLIHLPQRG